jgi:hypothetical protein
MVYNSGRRIVRLESAALIGGACKITVPLDIGFPGFSSEKFPPNLRNIPEHFYSLMAVLKSNCNFI